MAHHNSLQNVKALRSRGKQFNSYSQGEMYPKGTRSPAGGSPGDAYTMYAGMEAVDVESINSLFDDAEVLFDFFLSFRKLYLIRNLSGLYDSH